MEEKKELMTMEDTGIKGRLVNISDTYCSINPKTEESKKMLFKAMNNPEKRLKDCINMPITVVDVFCEWVDMVNESTGEMVGGTRIVLIDKDGIGYQCVSQGIFSALKKLFSIYGLPTWKNGITIVPKLINKGNNRSILTFDIQ